MTTPPSHDLRCPSKLHSRVFLVDGLWIIEVSCKSVFCGWKPGTVVLHRFGVNGDLLETKKFKDPGKKVNNGANQHPPSVRAS